MSFNKLILCTITAFQPNMYRSFRQQHPVQMISIAGFRRSDKLRGRNRLNFYFYEMQNRLQTADIQSGSEADIKQAVELAHKLGLKAKVLSETVYEDIGIGLAMKEGRTGKHINTDAFLRRLAGEAKN